MNRVILFFLLLYCAYPAASQINGYLYGHTKLFQTTALIEFNTLSNTAVTLNDFSEDYHAFGDHAIDPVHKRYLLIIGDSINMYLKDIDFQTGEVYGELFTVDSVGNGFPGWVTIGGNINSPFFNCQDEQVYFFHYKDPSDDSTHLAKVDPMSYEVTEIATFPIEWKSFDNVVRSNHQKIYLGFKNSAATYSELITYDLNSNTISSVNLSQPDLDISQLYLTYNLNDGNLYGVDLDLDSFVVNNALADLRVVKIDPETGAFEYLTEDLLANLSSYNVVFNYFNNKLYFKMQLNNPGQGQMGVYEIGGSAITVYPLTNPGGIGGIDLFALDKDCNVPTTIEPQMAHESCEEGLLPVFVGGMLTVQAGCDVNKHADLRIEIIDLLGRKLIDESVNGSPIIVSHILHSMAPYVYLFHDGNETISSGKVIFME